MSFRTVFVVLALGFGGRGLWADQIVMKNGDRVTGSIVKKDAKTLTIKTVHFGVVALPWDQVSSVTAVCGAGGREDGAGIAGDGGRESGSGRRRDEANSGAWGDCGTSR